MPVQWARSGGTVRSGAAHRLPGHGNGRGSASWSPAAPVLFFLD